MARLLNETEIEVAVEALTSGELVAFPTETVYGLGADASNVVAVNKIFAAKGRPTNHPLIAHVASISAVEELSKNLPPLARKLADAFWPGPLTLVVERSDQIVSEAVGGLDTVGVRMPDHPVALALLERFAKPIVGPSANKFGSVSPTLAKHVADDLGSDIGYILDGGPCAVGVESTIVDVTGPTPMLLRHGGISPVEIEAVANVAVVDGSGGQTRAPGMMKSHYAPKAQVELVNCEWLRSAVFETVQDVSLFADPVADSSIGVIAPFAHSHPLSWNLGEDARGYATQIYAAMREADAKGVERLLIAPPEMGDLVDAVVDRLTKAASGAPPK